MLKIDNILIISLKKIDFKFNKEFIVKTKIIRSMSILSEKEKEFYVKFASYAVNFRLHINSELIVLNIIFKK